MPNPTFHDKQGRPIDTATANRLLGDHDYARVALTEVTSRSDDSIRWRVSTVWLGLNHQWGDGPPLLFETMVFNGNDAADGLMERWSTEEDAKLGHAEIVATVAATVHDDVVKDLA